MDISKPNKIRIAALLALSVGAIAGYEGFTEVQRLAKIEQHGVTVDGMIDSGRSETHKGRRARTYRIDSFNVTYTPVGGKTVTESFTVTPEFFHSHIQDNQIVDPSVHVRYVGAHSSEERIIVGGSSDRKPLFLAGAGFLFFGMLAMGCSFFTKGQPDTSRP